MTLNTDDILDPDEEQSVTLEPLPPFAAEPDYLRAVSGLPIPTKDQIENFVTYAAGAKSWYKHLPARPPGSPMHFYLDPHAGRDRLRRWGHRVIYRDRTEHTEQFHYTWMTTAEYRRRFGYLAFCCPDVTRLFTGVMLDDGMATLDPNVMAPLIEIDVGTLVLVPKAVLLAGGCMVTRTVHEHTDAARLWRTWNKRIDPSGDDSGVRIATLTGHWPRISFLCEALAREGPAISDYLRRRPYPLPPVLPDSYPPAKEEAVRQFRAYEAELETLVMKQRAQDHDDMKTAINNMLDFVQRSLRPAT